MRPLKGRTFPPVTQSQAHPESVYIKILNAVQILYLLGTLTEVATKRGSVVDYSLRGSSSRLIPEG